MSKYFLTILFIIALSISQFAQSVSSNASQTMPENFKSDGCSWFPDGNYRDCCVQHDLAYFKGGSWTKRWQADKKLFQCVAAKRGFQYKILAPLMWSGVRVGGVHWLPTPFRWGFGKKKTSK